jgi:putative tryptophan/tyrosine transport system substrate-binding protein
MGNSPQALQRLQVWQSQKSWRRLEHRDMRRAGGLIGYGVDLLGLYRRTAYFIDKSLKDAKPADLPIEQPTQFELVINLNTAKTLGLQIAPAMLARAAEIIE